MASLSSGMLVEITGLPGPARPVPEAGNVAPLDLNGQRAQLIRLDRSAKKWVALTFNGDMIAVDSRHIRPLSGKELCGSYDFVFGPKSDFETVGYELADLLAAKGYAVMRLLVADEEASDMLAAATRLEEDGQFSRIAVEFERGYLGKDGSAKTLLLDPASAEAPEYIRESSLRMMDNNFGALSQMLGSYSEESLGFKVYSRTNLLLRMPLAEGDDDKYPPADIDDGDAEGYLQTMARKRLTLMQFVGPGSGTLTLTPLGVAEDHEAPEIRLQAEPHTVVFILSSRFEYTYQSAAKALTLTSFFLAEPAVYEITGEVDGDESLLGSLSNGPSPPPGEHCVLNALYCRYGGESERRDQYWNALKGSIDAITAIPFERWDHKPYYDPEGRDGKSYTKHGCFGIEGVDLFDCKFFEVSPAEARQMDPCQRQVLEVSYMALLEGGWDKRALQRESQNIGHFVGLDKDDWMCMSASGMLNMSGSAGATSSANSIVSNRFSYTMNLKGVSMTIDTACSSSLVCTHVSKLHLRFKEHEKMEASIVNGINLMLYPGPFIGCCAAGMLSHYGRCFTFNYTADGYARGECCGAACFKINQYKGDGQMLACLAGSQANQDGRSASLTAPNGPAQERCINAVLRECALTPTEVDSFECHGTGTALGDPIEVSAFRKVMSATTRKNPLSISSSKSNIAHGEGGAGFAGFVKCVLQVAYCEAAPSSHVHAHNAHLDMDGFPCQILTEDLPMHEDTAYSGVSSFGFGGTNAHAEAWGKNIMTTRSSRCAGAGKAFQKRLAAAPPAEITMNGDDVSEWETTGLDPRAEPGSRWSIFIDADGVAEWELVEEAPDFGDAFFLRSSDRDWQLVAMERHDTIDGLWTGDVTVGDEGEVSFQVIADEDTEQVFHPGQRRCALKGSKVHGPDRVSQEEAWLIQGEPGETFAVEFFKQRQHLSVLWLKR